ncbi:MAG TPA: DUF5681 domain-containing protein [Candidatus Acidoferrales bacterium]|nr:DUF5681 domain-containing protein [Candidatus Acidoferrales bacterium]
MSDKKAAALVPFQYAKGVSGNLSGRPKREPLTDQLKFLLNCEVPPEIRKTLARSRGKNRLVVSPGQTFADVLALRLLLRAIFGDFRATKEVFDRVEGEARFAKLNARETGNYELEGARERLIALFSWHETNNVVNYIYSF